MGNRPRTSPGWLTPLGEWVGGVGVSTVAELLREEGAPASVSSVYNWVEGRFPPSDFYAQALIRISDGKLDYNAIYSHRALIGKFPTPKGLSPRHEP